MPNFLFADGNPPAQNKKGGSFSKKSFSKDNAWNTDGNAKTFQPPDPGDGGGGNPIPISGGIAFLMIGSFVYFIRKIKDDTSN
ncbi:MAG: hypothetical protein JEZ09_01290 [Salinivirgaceae bacterium]|nr:hypothetical protein [Salinivirgaceae bacterium]